MTFVDTNVWMYAVGREHPLREEARAFLTATVEDPARRLCSSAEVLQEMLHAYLPVGRLGALDAATGLCEAMVDELWSVEPEDVRLARTLLHDHPGLGARDLLHLACCRRRGVRELKTFDRALSAAAAP